MNPSTEPRNRRAWLKAVAPLGLALLPWHASNATSVGTSAALAALATSPGWFNGPARGARDLQGKVVLVAFWTYSCINSLRVLPYLRAWAAKYEESGLVVVGVHTPEFDFEICPLNVERAISDLGVDFPVALDSTRRIWRAYDNVAWPALYFIDASGQLRARSIGEGHYDRSERLIQQLLKQMEGASVPAGLSAVSGTGPQAAPDLRNLRSAETYIGYGKASGFASPGGMMLDSPQTYGSPATLALDRWALGGRWTIGEEFATLDRAPGRIAFRFHARDLHLVLGPAAGGEPVRFRVRLEGKAPGADHGTDVDGGGAGTVRAPRMYQMVRQRRVSTDRSFEVEFLDPGVRAYVFTFG